MKDFLGQSQLRSQLVAFRKWRSNTLPKIAISTGQYWCLEHWDLQNSTQTPEIDITLANLSNSPFFPSYSSDTLLSDGMRCSCQSRQVRTLHCCVLGMTRCSNLYDGTAPNKYRRVTVYKQALMHLLSLGAKLSSKFMEKKTHALCTSHFLFVVISYSGPRWEFPWKNRFQVKWQWST